MTVRLCWVAAMLTAGEFVSIDVDAGPEGGDVVDTGVGVSWIFAETMGPTIVTGWDMTLALDDTGVAWNIEYTDPAMNCGRVWVGFCWRTSGGLMFLLGTARTLDTTAGATTEAVLVAELMGLEVTKTVIWFCGVDTDEMGLCKTVWDAFEMGIRLWFELTEGLDIEVRLKSTVWFELTLDTALTDCRFALLLATRFGLDTEAGLGFWSVSLVDKEVPIFVLCETTGLDWFSWAGGARGLSFCTGSPPTWGIFWDFTDKDGVPVLSNSWFRDVGASLNAGDTAEPWSCCGVVRGCCLSPTRCSTKLLSSCRLGSWEGTRGLAILGADCSLNWTVWCCSACVVTTWPSLIESALPGRVCREFKLCCDSPGPTDGKDAEVVGSTELGLTITFCGLTIICCGCGGDVNDALAPFCLPGLGVAAFLFEAGLDRRLLLGLALLACPTAVCLSCFPPELTMPTPDG